eukprot:4370886-Pyramimonas_sp.AAC.1
MHAFARMGPRGGSVARAAHVKSISRLRLLPPARGASTAPFPAGARAASGVRRRRVAGEGR